MNKKQLHHLYKRIRLIKPWYLLVLLVFFALLAVYGLRHNYKTMVELRDAVYTADAQNGNVETALQDLRRHVYGHMNTNLSSGKNAIKPPIQLKARYERLSAGDQVRIKQQNDAISAQGEAICAQQYPAAGYNAPRVACLQEYMRVHATTTVSSVPDALYKFDFISPRWSPDLAGWSIVFAVIFLILLILRVILERVIKKKLH
jgi:hypothetical protein